MEKKGLCDTCDNDKSCIFQSSFPILQCEEFTSLNHEVAKTSHSSQKKSKCVEEVTTEE